MTRTSLRPILVSCLLGLVIFSGCVEQAEQEDAPDAAGAVTLDGKADGIPSRESYRAVFSPGLLRSTRNQRMIKGLPSTTIGFAHGVGCELIRADTWKTKDLNIDEGAVFRIDTTRMSFLRYSTGQYGLTMKLRAYPNDDVYVPLEMQCWGYAMPTAEAVRDALLVGSYNLTLEFTPSTAKPTPAPTPTPAP